MIVCISGLTVVGTGSVRAGTCSGPFAGVCVCPFDMPNTIIATTRNATLAMSHLQRLQVRDAGFREFHVLLDEVVLHTAGLRGGERLDPVDAAVADGDLHALTA